jgi:hypothetical protein
LTSRDAAFVFEMERKSPFKPKYSGILEVQTAIPTDKYVKGYLINWVGIGLDAKDDIGGKSDPFIMIYVAPPKGNKTLIFSSETQVQTLNPVFKPFTLEVGQTGSWDDRTLLVECWDFDQSGCKHSIEDSITILYLAL